jgi:formylmethanofuran dehydrogenase subunit C
MILVEGNVGDYCGTRMIAGTIAVFGQAGHYTGFGMHRGTLLLSQPPIHLPVTFNECGQYDLLFLRLLAQVLYYSNSPKRTFLSRPVHRFVGDMACQGKGELLILGAVKPA